MATPNLASVEGPVLVLLEGGERSAIPLSRIPFTIGRSADRDLVLKDLGVSRIHASIHRGFNGGYELRDEHSRFGTFVNGQPVQSQELNDGDQIQLGHAPSQIIFRLHNDETPSRDWLSGSSSATPGASELEQLNLFLQAARSLNTTRVLNDVLNILLDYTLRITGAERGYVFLRQPTGELKLAQGRDARGISIDSADGISRSVLEECANSSVEFLIGDTSRDQNVSERNSIVTLDLRTVIAIPLRRINDATIDGSNPILGVLYLDSHFTTRNLSGCSPEILRAIATEAARVVENARLVEAEQAARQYQQELEIASSIQQRLVSVKLPQTPYVEVNARTVPCKDIGGDVYDAVLTPNGVAFMLADVSGKGISAALLASVIQGMLYAQLSAGTPLASAIAGLNRFLCERVAGQKYATILLAEIRVSGDTELICCGHVPPLLVRGGKAERLSEGCMPVGLFESASFSVYQIQLQPGDALVFVTDGVTEATNDDDLEFGDDRFELCTQGPDAVSATFSALQEWLGSHILQDDCSMMEIRYKG